MKAQKLLLELDTALNEAAKEQLGIAKFLKTALVDIKHDYIQKAFGQFMAKVNVDFRYLNGTKDNWYFQIRFQDERGNNVFQPGLVPDEPPTPYNDGFIPFSSVNEGHRLKILMAFMLNIPQDGMRIFLLIQNWLKKKLELEEYANKQR